MYREKGIRTKSGEENNRSNRASNGQNEIEKTHTHRSLEFIIYDISEVKGAKRQTTLKKNQSINSKQRP